MGGRALVGEEGKKGGTQGVFGVERISIVNYGCTCCLLAGP